MADARMASLFSSALGVGVGIAVTVLSVAALEAIAPVCSRVNSTPAVVDGGLSAVFARAAMETTLQPRVLSTDPWLVVFDAFASTDECDDLIDVFAQQTTAVQSGITTAKSTKGGHHHIRSSSSSWCDATSCYDNAIVQRLVARLSGLTSTPTSNAEVLQLLRYERGQEYKMHHDFMGGADASAAGGRVYSFVLFLSTPEAGGDLYFADLNISVPATKGAAVLWPSLMDSDLSLPELHTHHASRPVMQGTKLAAVTWIRMHDFRTLALERGCPAHAYSAPLTTPPLLMLPAYLEARERAGLEARVPPSLLSRLQGGGDAFSQ